MHVCTYVTTTVTGVVVSLLLPDMACGEKARQVHDSVENSVCYSASHSKSDTGVGLDDIVLGRQGGARDDLCDSEH